jgi:hypothetical protein
MQQDLKHRIQRLEQSQKDSAFALADASVQFIDAYN